MGWVEFWEATGQFDRTGIHSAKHEAQRGLGPWWQHFLRGGARGATRLTWGVWVSSKRLPSSPALVAHVVGQLAPRGLVGVRSAAAMHGLLEAPDVVDVIVPRGAWRTTAPWPIPHRRFTVTRIPEALDVPVERGLFLGVTSRLHTLVDLLRFRDVVGPRLAASALRRFLDAGGDAVALRVLAHRQRASTGLTQLERLARALPPPPPVLDCRPLVFPPGCPERTPPLVPER